MFHSELLLGSTAGLIELLAYLLYNRQMSQAHSRPNMATWAIWGLLCVLNGSSYLSLSGAWYKALPPLVSSVACLATGAYAWWAGKFKNEAMTSTDKIVLAIALLASLVWCCGDASYGNLCLQLALIASFAPTVIDLWRDPSSERWTPWAMWASAYALMGFTVFLNYSHWMELACPASGLLLNGLVGCLSRR